MTFIARVCVCISVIALVACDRQPAIDDDAERQGLLAVDRAWSGFGVEEQIGFLAADAVLMVEGMPLIAGKDAIAKVWREEAEIPGFTIAWEPESAVVSASGELGYTLGSNAISVNDSTGLSTTTNGKYVTIWRKQADGSWKVVVDIVNSDSLPITDPQRDQ
jgi:ketosteroid isomerase-like protein